MNREDIIRMAKEFGVWGPFMGEDEDLERFFQAAYAAGATAEREACAQLVESLDGCAQYFPHVPDAIRARGEMK